MLQRAVNYASVWADL